MYYELWDIEDRNLLYDFPNAQETREAVEELIELNPLVYPEKMALARIDDEGNSTWLGTGDQIIGALKSDSAREARRSA